MIEKVKNELKNMYDFMATKRTVAVIVLMLISFVIAGIVQKNSIRVDENFIRKLEAQIEETQYSWYIFHELDQKFKNQKKQNPTRSSLIQYEQELKQLKADMEKIKQGEHPEWVKKHNEKYTNMIIVGFFCAITAFAIVILSMIWGFLGIFFDFFKKGSTND
jgi:septal ring factor EnvC (AmiA/AmiB activator)